MDPRVFAHKQHDAQVGLREGARAVSLLCGSPDCMPDIPALAQKVAGHKRETQQLRQYEAMAVVFQATARVLTHIAPDVLHAAVAAVQAEIDAAIPAPEAEAEEIPDATPEPFDFGSTDFEGFLEYTVLVAFTMEGKVTPDGPNTDHPVAVGQKLMLQPEAAEAWLGAGLIQLSDPQPAPIQTPEGKGEIPAIVNTNAPDEAPRLCYDVLKEIEVHENGARESILFPDSREVSIYLTDEEAAPHVATGHLRVMDPQPAPIIADDEVAAITPTDNPEDPQPEPPAIPPVAPAPVREGKTKNKKRK